MKIVWFCIPAHGHTNPTLGLVKEMTDAGHEVYYFSFEQFREKIEHAGARFIPCDEYDFEMKDKENADRVGKDMAFATELLVKTTFAFNQHSSGYMKQSIGGLFKMLFSMPKMNREIRKLQKKGYPVKNILEIISNDNETNTIVYTSKEFQPCAETFSDKYCFIGPSIRPFTGKMEKTAEKTVYISMGTVVKNHEIYQNCLEVLGNTEYQVIISLGDHELEYDSLPENVKVYRSVDQMAILSIADVFLTHCGMNSASEALYFKVPLVMFPQTPEQGAVARRVEELGAGKKLESGSKEEILQVIETVLSDSRYKTSASEISAGFKKCGGAKAAKVYLEKLINTY